MLLFVFIQCEDITTEIASETSCIEDRRAHLRNLKLFNDQHYIITDIKT